MGINWALLWHDGDSAVSGHPTSTRWWVGGNSYPHSPQLLILNQGHYQNPLLPFLEYDGGVNAVKSSDLFMSIVGHHNKDAGVIMCSCDCRFRVALDLFLCVMIWTVGIPHYSCIYVLQNLGIPQSIKWQLPFTVLALAFCSTFVYLINSQNNTSAPRLYLSLTLWYHK